jgi:hypothetical protein
MARTALNGAPDSAGKLRHKDSQSANSAGPLLAGRSVQPRGRYIRVCREKRKAHPEHHGFYSGFHESETGPHIRREQKGRVDLEGGFKISRRLLQVESGNTRQYIYPNQLTAQGLFCGVPLRAS